ncbi:DUF2264 domain-containing protein [Clostridiales bacterium COT073_COT-073]|nr:DUF2264 domain-containing protein [Clostridiales bacterium COT073_COT-073]
MKTEVLLKTREDAVRLLLDIIRPLKKFYSQGKAYLEVNPSGVHYGRRIAGMEGFARILWGLGPLWAGENQGLSQELQQEIEEWQEHCITGIKNGTNPQHPEYWGEINDFDQRMVEMAALAVTISLSPQRMYYDWSEIEQQNLYHWLNRINSKQVHGNNWRYFRILVNMTFQLLDLPYSEACLEDDFALINSCYTGEGWYFDGNPWQIDYYVAFAIHFYGLIYAKLKQEKEPDFYRSMLEKSNAFAKDFVYWFANDGRELPFGRSLTYRFAHNSFFGALAFAGGTGLSYGVMKNLVLRNLEQWMKRPIFNQAGVLSIGYHYPNLFMSEVYNGGGSPYWALKSFIILALPESHPFWQAMPEDFAYQPLKKLSHPHMLISHDSDNHLQAFVTGQHCRNDHGACTAKYEKLVYSNQFGFSVSRGTSLLAGAFDSVLAVSPAGRNHFVAHQGEKEFKVTDDYVMTKYQPMSGVSVITVVVPCGSWHIRWHQIVTDQAIEVADGGYAIEAEDAIGQKYGAECQTLMPNQAFVQVPGGISGVISFSEGRAEIVRAFPNTNLFYPLTVIPTICYQLKAGQHSFVDAVFGDRGPLAEVRSQTLPQIATSHQEMVIRQDGREICIDLSDLL